MRLNSVILRVSDMSEATAFWSEMVGLAVLSQSPQFTFLDAGEVQLVLNHVGRSVTDESMTEVVLTVEDVRASFDELSRRGVPFEVELRAITSDGERDLVGAHFRDPDGHYGSLTGWVDRVEA